VHWLPEQWRCLALNTLDNLIDGKSQPARSGAMLESIDPSTGPVWATVPRRDASDVADAVGAARDAIAATERGEVARSVVIMGG
jgi:acyl-CoA reductase-like NAD-dependent aldehyde dehydrogenase